MWRHSRMLLAGIQKKARMPPPRLKAAGTGFAGMTESNWIPFHVERYFGLEGLRGRQNQTGLKTSLAGRMAKDQPVDNSSYRQSITARFFSGIRW